MAKTPDSRRPELAGGQNRGSKKGSKYDPKRVIFDPFLGPLFWGPSGAGLRESGVLAMYRSKVVQKGTPKVVIFGSYLTPWDRSQGGQI